jgi:hypothetical protein
LYDLSAGGCLVESLIEATSEYPVRLRIDLPDGNSVTVRGIVTPPTRGIGYAVRFVDVDPTTREMIERALAYARDLAAQN